MITLAAISLAAPLMLMGIAAIALPIAAHLMNRRTRQRLVFPTIRLLTESRATQSNLYRIRRWILLLLRCLAIIMIAMAFTMPSCTPKASMDPTPDGAQGVALVFIIDVSASLDRDPITTGGTSLKSTMQAAAERALSTLRQGEDRVNVVFAGASPRALFAAQRGQSSLSGNHEAVRQGLRSMTLTQERADLPAAIAMAGDLLRDAGAAGQRRVVILSDMQLTNWLDVTLAAGDRADSKDGAGAGDGASDSAGAGRGTVASYLPAGTMVTILPLETGDVGNLALSESRSEPVMPVVNQPALLVTKVGNLSSEAREVTVAAMVDGQPIGTRTIALNPRESREVGFETIINRAGTHRVEFWLPDDALKADNRSHLIISAVQRVQVVVVGDDDPAQLGSASYFISRALSPRGDAADLIQVRFITSADLAQADVSAAQAIIISQVERLDDDGCRLVVDYLNRGGGVIFYSDGLFVPANFAALQSAAEAIAAERIATPGQVGSPSASASASTAAVRIMPWTPAQPRELLRDDEQLRITEGAWNSPLLAEFDEQSRRALAQVRFRRVWTVADPQPGASVLLRFNDGTPALALMAVGEGRLVVANFSPALTAGDLGKYGSFVALSHSLARYIRPRLDARNQITTGSPLITSANIPVGESPGSFVIEGPAGEFITPEMARAGSRVTIVTQRAESAGFYRVLRNDQPVVDLAVNIDPRESDLRPLDETAIATQLNAPGLTVEVQVHAAAADVLQVRGQPLWHWFILAAMVFIGLELALLSVWNR